MLKKPSLAQYKIVTSIFCVFKLSYDIFTVESPTFQCLFLLKIEIKSESSSISIDSWILKKNGTLTTFSYRPTQIQFSMSKEQNYLLCCFFCSTSFSNTNWRAYIAFNFSYIAAVIQKQYHLWCNINIITKCFITFFTLDYKPTRIKVIFNQMIQIYYILISFSFAYEIWY